MKKPKFRVSDRIKMTLPWEAHPYGGTLQWGIVVAIDPPSKDAINVMGHPVKIPGVIWVRFDVLPRRDYKANDTLQKLSLLELIADAAR